MHFSTYGLPKTWLDKCQKSQDAEDPSRNNTVNARKHG